MNYHPLTHQIIDLLTKNNFWFETFKHAPVTTSEEAAKLRHGYTIDQGAKALIVRIKKINNEKSFAMLVLPGSKKFNIDKAKHFFNAKDIRFVTLEELSQITNGVERGGVPPFGNLFNIKVYADKTLFNNEKIIFNAGDRGFSVAIKAVDYTKLVNPEIIEIV